MNIAILGAGPSGMMAAHAASQCGAHVDIIDAAPDQSRRNSGVYYLHDDCDLLLDSVQIRQGLLGGHILSLDEIQEAYGMKVYGKSVAKTSVLEPLRHPIITGYNSGQAIDRLWDMYGLRVHKNKINGIDDVPNLMREFDQVISTIPAYILYPELDKYEFVETHIKVGKAPVDEAFIFYNINEHCDWYRCSAMFGIFIQEFGFGKKAPVDESLFDKYVTVKKIIGDGVTSTLEGLHLTGRYGAWNKKFLTHDVYYDVLKWLGYSG